MNLSQEAEAVIIGSLLGDAYLYRNGTLQIEHCYEHAAYTLWKYEKLKSIAGKPPTIVGRYDKRTNKTYRSSRFYTKSVLKDFRCWFYEDNKKIIPDNLGEKMNALALAVWFMDDGSRGARTPKGLVFNTSCFSEQEQCKLQSILTEKFKVKTSVHRIGKGFQIYVKAESFDTFVSLVKPNLVTLMRYKLPADPVTTEAARLR